MRKLQGVLVALVTLLAAGGAAGTTLTFDDLGLVHGSVVNTQYAGVTISADNTGGGPDLAVAFNSGLTGTRDTDLEFGSGWVTGNLSPDTQLGMLLIIQENSTGCNDGVCNLPDDEGTRPAGTLIFDFDIPVLSFGFDLVDVEDFVVENGSIAFFDGASSVVLQMASIFPLGATTGDNSANRIGPIQMSALNGLKQITRVEFRLKGSGGVDNVTFDVVPEPSSAALIALGLVALGMRARARRDD